MQIQILMRDMLFLNYRIPLERLRPLVPEELELETRPESGSSFGFISAVAFTNLDIKAGVLPMLRACSDQINYRTYVTAGEGPAVYFFDMKIDSRVLATGTSFLGLPVSHEDITIKARPISDTEETEKSDSSPRYPRFYRVESEGPEGLTAEAIVGEESARRSELPSEFITERPIGYVKAPGGGMLKIVVEHERIETVPARVTQVKSLLFESLGLLNEEEMSNPYSVFYTPEITFITTPPALWLP
jgi:uncharacterized protein YqjF (DUF2071 family)